MHPSAVAHVYCTYPAGLNAAYDNNGDTSAGTLVDYSGQGCPGDATVVAMDDTLIRPTVIAWFDDRATVEATYGHISTWDTSGVKDMSELFRNADSFNEDIGAWDTSGVTSFSSMFTDASSFNQDISGWRVDKVTTMQGMFAHTQAFNIPLGSWRVDNVVEMGEMFYNALAFNQDISGWAIDSVTDLYGMFRAATAFDQDLGWCVDDGVDLRYAFDDTPCYSTSCGVTQGSSCSITGYVMDDSTIRTAVCFRRDDRPNRRLRTKATWSR